MGANTVSKLSREDKERLRRSLRATYGSGCFYCGQEMDFDPGSRHPLAVTFEHLVPVSKGGRGLTNVVLACWECNHRVADRPLKEKLQCALAERVEAMLRHTRKKVRGRDRLLGLKRRKAAKARAARRAGLCSIGELMEWKGGGGAR